MPPYHVNQKLALTGAFFALQHETKKGVNQPNTATKRKAGASQAPAPANSGPNIAR
jgi:hypothetical protein